MNGPLCPFCLTSNIPGTQLCIKCDKPIASNAMDSMMKEAEQNKLQTEQIKKQLEELQKKQNELHEIVRYSMAHTLNDGMQGRAHTRVLGELASRFEKTFDEAEKLSLANQGEEVKIVLQGQTKSVELSPKDIERIKSAIKEFRDNNNNNNDKLKK